MKARSPDRLTPAASEALKAATVLRLRKLYSLSLQRTARPAEHPGCLDGLPAAAAPKAPRQP